MLKRTIFRKFSRASHRQRCRFTSVVEAFAIGSFQRLVRVNVLIEVEMLNKHSMYMKSECAIALLVSHVSNLCFGAKNAQKSTYSFRAKASALFLQFLERLEQRILIFERFEQM